MTEGRKDLLILLAIKDDIFHKVLCKMKWMKQKNYNTFFITGVSLVVQMVKKLPVMQETWVRFLGWEDTLEKGMAMHSNILAWRIPWSFSFNISPSNEHPGLISFRMDWLDLLAVHQTLKGLLQHHSSKASIL